MKTNKCRFCKEKLGYLTYFSKVAVSQDYSGSGEYGMMEDFGDHSEDSYNCPYCYERLAASEEEADKVLKVKR